MEREERLKNTDGTWSLLNMLPFTKLPGKVIAENKRIINDLYYVVNHKKVDLKDYVTSMQQSTRIYGGDEEFDCVDTLDTVRYHCDLERSEHTSAPTTRTIIKVENRDCLSVYFDLKNETNQPTLLLNLAQRRSNDVCGKWDIPYMGTQEEYIERRSGVYRLALNPQFNTKAMLQLVEIQKRHQVNAHDTIVIDHHIPRFASVFHQNVPIIRDENYNLTEEVRFVDVVATGAIDMREHKNDLKNLVLGEWNRVNESAAYFTEEIDERNQKCKVVNTELFMKHTRMKIEMVFCAALERGYKNLVLGALGCGAFKNDPHLIIECFKQVINSDLFKNRFHVISFAVLGEPNYSLFHDGFK